MKRSRPKKNRNIPIPTASMGDIAFLLIIFFLLLSDFAKDRDLQMQLPQSQWVGKSEAAVAARVAMDAQGVIYFDGQRVESAKDIEWGVRALLAKTLTDDQRRVQFKCDQALAKDKFEPVLKAIAEAGGIIDAVGEEP